MRMVLRTLESIEVNWNEVTNVLELDEKESTEYVQFCFKIEKVVFDEIN